MVHPRMDHGGKEGGGDNGGYILGMCSGLSLVASYSSPHKNKKIHLFLEV